MALAWIVLVLSGMLEAGWALSLKASEGFTRLWPSVSFVVMLALSMVGLSYGGFYTLFTAAADPRIKSCIASGFFNDRFAHNWLDWTWKDAGHTFMDAEIGALIAPRGLKMQLGTHDNLFAEAPARKELERLKTFFERAHCPEKLYMEFFDGTHEFSKSEETIDLFMNDLA